MSRFSSFPGSRQLTALVSLAYAFFFVWFSVLGPMCPIGSWDMFPYVGAAYGLTRHPDELRAVALADIRRYVSDGQYRAITSGSDYRETVAREDRAFLQQLPMYQVKPLYVLLTALLGAIIGNLALATVVLAATGFSLIGIALYLLRPAGYAGVVWLLAVIGITYLGTPQLVLLARASSPDSMAAALLLLGLAAFFKKGQAATATVLFSLAVMTRPDYVIPIAFLFPIFLRARMDRFCSPGGFYAIACIPIGIFLLLKTLGLGYGLTTIIFHSVSGAVPYPADTDTSIVPELYLLRLQENLQWFLSSPRLILFVAVSVLSFVASRDSYVRLIVLAAIGNVIARVLLFPAFEGGYQERYFFLSYFLTLIALFHALGASPLDRMRRDTPEREFEERANSL